MITKDEILEAIQETDDDWNEWFEKDAPLDGVKPDDWDEIYERLINTVNFGQSEVYSILYFLDIEDIDERLEWYNGTKLNLADIERLANVKFYTVECDWCSAVLYEGEPDNWINFQNAMNVEICHVEGELNGSNVDVNFCEKCYHTVKNMLDF